jgi:integrase
MTSRRDSGIATSELLPQVLPQTAKASGTLKFTDRAIKNLKAKNARYELWEGNGFGIRVTPSGTKSWVFVYHHAGRSRRMTLGTYPSMTVAQAHQAHGKALTDLEQGIDPGAAIVRQRRVDRAAPTLGDLATEYLERWAKPRKRSWKEDERILNKDVLPPWRWSKAKEITRSDVIALLDRIVDRGSPIAANRTLAVVRRLFNFALSRDLVSANPCAQVKPPGKENRRDRVLSPDELRTFWNGLNEASMSAASRIALKLLLVTAQRKGEVISARWEDIDIAGAWWTIPAERSKNGLPHRVPLSRLAISLLAEARELAGEEKSPWVFPSPKKEHIGPTALGHAVRRSIKDFGLTDFTPHDLRRTTASYMTSIGIPRLVVSKLLNHVEQGVTAIYDRHSYDADKRKAISRWERHLKLILEAQLDAARVTPISAAR